MKKSILFILTFLSTSSLMAIGYMSWNNYNADLNVSDGILQTEYNSSFIDITFGSQDKADFFYDVDSRFMTTISKNDLHQAMTVFDLVPIEATQRISFFWDVKIGILSDDGNKIEKDKGKMLNLMMHNWDYCAKQITPPTFM